MTLLKTTCNFFVLLNNTCNKKKKLIPFCKLYYIFIYMFLYIYIYIYYINIIKRIHIC